MSYSMLAFPWEVFDQSSGSFAAAAVSDHLVTAQTAKRVTQSHQSLVDPLTAQKERLAFLQEVVPALGSSFQSNNRDLVTGIPTSGLPHVDGTNNGVVPSGSGTSLVDYNTLKGRLLRASEATRQKFDQLNMQTPREAEKIIVDLRDLALPKVHKVAVAIRGDYRPSFDENAPVRVLLKEAQAAFANIEQSAKQSLKQIADTQSSIVDYQTNTLGLLKKDVTNLVNQTTTSLEGLEQQLKTTQNGIGTLGVTQKQNLDSAAELQQKMESAKSKNTGINIGIGLLGPVGGLIATGVDELFIKSRQGYEDAIREVAKAEETIKRLQSHLSELYAVKSRLESQRSACAILQTQLSSLGTYLQTAQTQAGVFMTAMNGLQETATKLGRLVMAIIPPVSTTTELAYTKAEIVLGLMKVCESALINSRLADECRHICIELVSGYGKALPEDTKEVFDKVQKGLVIWSNPPRQGGDSNHSASP